MFVLLVVGVVVAWRVFEGVFVKGPPASALSLAPPPPTETVELFPAVIDTEKGAHYRGLKPGRRFGFIDREGRMVIEPKFVGAKGFSEGLAPAAVPHVHEIVGGKIPLWGFIDASGEFVIPPQFYDADPFSEGLAGVEVNSLNDSWGYIDRLGRLVIEPLFSESPYRRLVDGKPFMREGIAFGLFAWAPIMGDSSLYSGALIDLGGRVIKEYTGRTFRKGTFQDGLLLIDWHGYVNRVGEVVINVEPFDNHVSPFSEGMAEVAQRRPRWYLERGWGYMDTSGTLRIECQYEDVLPFYKGKAWVKELARPWKIIDKEGNEASPLRFDFDRMFPFSEDRALVQDGNRYGLVDTEGKVYPIEDPTFPERPVSKYLGFRNGLAELRFGGSFYMQIYIDRSGKVIWRSDQPEKYYPDYEPETDREVRRTGGL